MNEQIWKYIAELSTPGFFVTADIMYEGEEFPVDIKAFIIETSSDRNRNISPQIYVSFGRMAYSSYFFPDRPCC